MRRLLVLPALLSLALVPLAAQGAATPRQGAYTSGKNHGKGAPFYASGGRLYRSYGKAPTASTADSVAARRLWEALHHHAPARPATKKHAPLKKQHPKGHGH